MTRRSTGPDPAGELPALTENTSTVCVVMNDENDEKDGAQSGTNKLNVSLQQHHQCLYWFPEINSVTRQLSSPSVFPAGVTAAKHLSQQGPEEQTVLEVFLRLFTPTSGGVVTSDAFTSKGTTQAYGC